MPDSETALNRLRSCISEARHNGKIFLIIIHGYGSSGRGGVIKEKIRKYLKEKNFRYVVYGENMVNQWNNIEKSFNIRGKERDFFRKYYSNRGITIVVF